MLIKEIHNLVPLLKQKIFVIKWKEIRENIIEFMCTWVVSTHGDSGKFRF